MKENESNKLFTLIADRQQTSGNFQQNNQILPFIELFLSCTGAKYLYKIQVSAFVICDMLFPCSLI